MWNKTLHPIKWKWVYFSSTRYAHWIHYNSFQNNVTLNRWIHYKITTILQKNRDMQFWMSRFIRNQFGRSAEEAIGVRFTRNPSVDIPSSLDFAKIRQSHGKFQVQYCNFREGRRQVDIARITGVTEDGISNILKQALQTRSPNQRHLGHCQRISTHREDWYLLRHVLIGFCQASS